MTATSRPPAGSIENAERTWRKIRVLADAGDARRRRERRVHENDGRLDVPQEVRDGLGVVAGDVCAAEDPGQQSRIRTPAISLKCSAPDGAAPKRALGHHGQHPRPSGRFQHDVSPGLGAAAALSAA